MCKNKILLVEDQPILQRVHRLYLEKMGVEVEVAVNGEQAVEMYMSRFYHLIILDAGLPDKKGVDVGKEIRALEKKNQKKRTPIILLSAYSPKLLKQWCKEAEIDEFALKPIYYNELYQMLKNYLDMGSSVNSESINPIIGKRKKRKIV